MQYNIYFRKHNWESFKDEPNKSELINKLLTGHYGGRQEAKKPSVNYVPGAEIDSVKYAAPLDIPGVQQGAEVWKPSPPDPIKGYPCCSQKKPCKHWQWDGGSQGWMNTITGELKEA